MIEVVAIHTNQPFTGVAVLRRQLDDLRELAETSPRPVILAGDFNATRQHRPFRRLLEGRLRDAHLETGRGLATTWPVGRRIPTTALLDHVLVTEEIGVRSTAEESVPGSDHRAVKAVLTVPR